MKFVFQDNPQATQWCKNGSEGCTQERKDNFWWLSKWQVTAQKQAGTNEWKVTPSFPLTVGKKFKVLVSDAEDPFESFTSIFGISNSAKRKTCTNKNGDWTIAGKLTSEWDANRIAKIYPQTYPLVDACVASCDAYHAECKKGAPVKGPCVCACEPLWCARSQRHSAAHRPPLLSHRAPAGRAHFHRTATASLRAARGSRPCCLPALPL